MRLSLIITTYNWPESLAIVLKSIESQTMAPEEVIIADDGSTFETQETIASFQKESELNIIHSWQEDIGFRVAMSRNRAILKSSGDYIILIDGDMILHPKFIQDHIRNAQSRYYTQGVRTLLTQEETEQILDKQKIKFSFFSHGIKNRKNSIHSNLMSKLFSTKKNQLHGVKSCNMGFYKQDCINVNGFNNEFEGWGREDSEFVVRLLNSGVKRKNIRFNAIQFHLWHNENIRDSIDRNNSILQNTIDKRMQWCKNGINFLDKNES